MILESTSRSYLRPRIFLHFWTPMRVSPLKTEFQLTGTVIEPTKTAFLRLT